jgi:hypothetical protein
MESQVPDLTLLQILLCWTLGHNYPGRCPRLRLVLCKAAMRC